MYISGPNLKELKFPCLVASGDQIEQDIHERISRNAYGYLIFKVLIWVSHFTICCWLIDMVSSARDQGKEGVQNWMKSTLQAAIHPVEPTVVEEPKRKRQFEIIEPKVIGKIWDPLVHLCAKTSSSVNRPIGDNCILSYGFLECFV